MKCVRCGADMDDQAMVCGQCGAVVGMTYGGKKVGAASTFPDKGSQPHLAQKSTPPLLSSGGERAPDLVSRVKSILTAPRREWPVIASEPSLATDIFFGYALPLATIGAVALFLAEVVLGTSVPMLGVFRQGVVNGLVAAVALLAFTLAHLYILAWLIVALVRRFGGGETDRLQALKLAAYSYTPIWLAGILYLFPALSLLWLFAALYALYLAFVGLPILTRCPPGRAIQLALVAAVAAYLLTAVFAALLVALFGFGPAVFG